MGASTIINNVVNIGFSLPSLAFGFFLKGTEDDPVVKTSQDQLRSPQCSFGPFKRRPEASDFRSRSTGKY